MQGRLKAAHLQHERADCDLPRLAVLRAAVGQHLDHDAGAAHGHEGAHECALEWEMGREQKVGVLRGTLTTMLVLLMATRAPTNAPCGEGMR